VETWFRAQADLTERALAGIPGRKALVDEWMALDKLKPASYSGIVAEKRATCCSSIRKTFTRAASTSARIRSRRIREGVEALLRRSGVHEDRARFREPWRRVRGAG